MFEQGSRVHRVYDGRTWLIGDAMMTSANYANEGRPSITSALPPPRTYKKE